MPAAAAAIVKYLQKIKNAGSIACVF